MKSTDRKDPHYVFPLLSCHFLSLHLSCSVCVSRVLGHVLQVTRSYLAYYGLCVQTWTSCNAMSQELWRITVSVMVGLSINYVNRIVIIWSVLLFMSMGRDYASELRPPTGLLFIPQVIYEYGEPRCNDINRENRKISEKIAPLTFRSPQIPYGVSRARTRASTVTGRRLTVWVMPWPSVLLEACVRNCFVGCTVRFPRSLEVCCSWGI
jgi:hypothetical protein